MQTTPLKPQNIQPINIETAEVIKAESSKLYPKEFFKLGMIIKEYEDGPELIVTSVEGDGSIHCYCIHDPSKISIYNFNYSFDGFVFYKGTSFDPEREKYLQAEFDRLMKEFD